MFFHRLSGGLMGLLKSDSSDRGDCGGDDDNDLCFLGRVGVWSLGLLNVLHVGLLR